MPGPGRERRSVAGHDGSMLGDDLIDVLRDADFDLVSDLDLRRIDPTSRRGAGAAGSDIALPVAASESAVLLIETTNGALRWLRPLARETAPLDRRDAVGPRQDTLHFSLDGGGAADAASARRGVLDQLAGKVIDPVRTLVLRFVVSRTIDAAVARIEGGNPTGPVAIGGSNPAAWIPRNGVAQPVAWRSGRVLLMVHGTFSSTAGSFAGLAAHDEGKRFLDAAQARYDLVLGFDHRTLAEDPVTNAEAILATLTALHPPAGTVIDAVAYSRGGLVFRALAEQLLPTSGLDVAVGTVVLVGCTNGGTHLAEPLNWAALVDSYTNLLVAAERDATALAGAPQLSPFVTLSIRTLGRFVQMFSEVAISDRRVPGLAAMEPGSPLVTALNETEAALGSAAYHAITSSYEADGGVLPGAVGSFVLDRVTDALFNDPNDCVVDTGSMTMLGRQTARLGECFAFGDTAEVMHTSYFRSTRVAEELSGRLGLKGGGVRRGPTMLEPLPERFEPRAIAPVEIEMESLEIEAGGFAPIAGPPPDSAPAPSSSGPLTSFPPPQPPRPVAAAPDVPAPSPPPSSVERFIAAEMMPFPDIDRDARIYITLSGTRIDVTVGATAAASAEGVTLLSGMPAQVVLIPVRNIALPGNVIATEGANSGLAYREVDPRIEQTVSFTARGIAVGPAELTVQLRQNGHIFASFSLAPTFVSANAQALVAGQTLVAAAAPPTGDEADEERRSMVLRIYETVQPNGALALRFELVCDALNIGVVDTRMLDPRFDLSAYVASVLGEVEGAWNLSRVAGQYEAALDRFVASARIRTEAMMPDSIRRSLWEHRDEIVAIQVIGDVPLIPWELMALVPPPGIQPPADPSRRFLSDFGLVRWLPGVPQPGRAIRLNGARSRYIIPRYVRAGSNLPGAQEEQAMLEAALPGIQPIKASSIEVANVLRSEASDIDVLHFACHGLAEQKAVLSSYLLMAGFSGPPPADDPLTVDQVKASACFGSGERRPLVFLNACQTGREGEGIAGVAGFADAFIRPLSGCGAAAFVGALWSVTDSLAQDFAKAFYERLNQGDRLVDAVKSARAAARTGDDFTWLAYAVYGNPFARGVAA